MNRTRTPTILDVAAEAGVSKSAVSRALLGQGSVSAENRERIEMAAAKLGYVANAVARSLVSARTRTIGVVLRDVRKPYYSYLQAAIQAEAERQDYRIVTTTNARDLEVEDAVREITNLISLQVDGLVIAPARLPSEVIAPFLDRLPIVVAGRRETLSGLSSVSTDDAGGGAALTTHLRSLGHERIAVALVDHSYSHRYHERGTAMLDQVTRSEGQAVPFRARRDLDVGARFDEEFGRLEAAGVTAVMCPNDAAAMDVLEALRSRGSGASERYSVTGYDGYGPLASPYIGLTTFRTPQEEVGRSSADLLIERIEGRTDQDKFVSLRGSVVVGRTARRLTV
jgi:DNA-binding LacI/PurR family transcriptional regulator